MTYSIKQDLTQEKGEGLMIKGIPLQTTEYQGEREREKETTGPVTYIGAEAPEIWEESLKGKKKSDYFRGPDVSE